MRGSLISNFLVLENTVARAACHGEHGFGKDDENSSVSGDESIMNLSNIDHLRQYFIFMRRENLQMRKSSEN